MSCLNGTVAPRKHPGRVPQAVHCTTRDDDSHNEQIMHRALMDMDVPVATVVRADAKEVLTRGKRRSAEVSAAS
jgi:hypothetical protein